MKEILTALMIWLGANTPFDTNHDIPNVLFLTQSQMEELYYVEDQEKFPNQLHGLYNRENNTIVLPDTWDRRKPWDLGVLIHEMVHYLQDVNQLEFECTAQMEKEAWPIQKQYLKEQHNYDWDYDQLWFLVVSNCNDAYNF